MTYQQLIELLKARGYQVADDRTKQEVYKTWKMPYCAAYLGEEATTGSDFRPLILKQPIDLALYTQGIDRAEQKKIKAIINTVTAAYTMDGNFIENGKTYETIFKFTLTSKLK